MTIYAYPEEMNYPEIQTKGWFNMEVFNKQQPRDLVDINKVLPKEFLKDELGGHFTGKWIYLSLGSMCSVDIDLMKRIVRLLGETNHKYVVSKGTRGEEYSLPKNMWGDRYVPQIEIIKFVDLVSAIYPDCQTLSDTFYLPSFYLKTGNNSWWKQLHYGDHCPGQAVHCSAHVLGSI